MVGMLTISGFPASGKTTRALELVSFFERKIAASDVPAIKRLKVTMINDESLGLSKTAYDDSRAEKPARATLFSAVTRVLSKDTIVIVDAMNYIKGSRYQMYCNAREAGCRTCTVFVAAPPEKCREWNGLKPEAETYAEATLDNLISRFEEPSSVARWDKPLFTVSCFDPPLDSPSIEDGGNVDAERIWAALISGDIKPPNVATLPVVTSTTSYLTLLEQTTTTLITTLLSTQALSPLSGPTSLLLPTTPPVRVTITLYKAVSMTMCQRLKRQFTRLNQHARNEMGVESIAQLFATYLEDATRDILPFNFEIAGVAHLDPWGSSMLNINSRVATPFRLFIPSFHLSSTPLFHLISNHTHSNHISPKMLASTLAPLGVLLLAAVSPTTAKSDTADSGVLKRYYNNYWGNGWNNWGNNWGNGGYYNNGGWLCNYNPYCNSGGGNTIIINEYPHQSGWPDWNWQGSGCGCDGYLYSQKNVGRPKEVTPGFQYYGTKAGWAPPQNWKVPSEDWSAPPEAAKAFHSAKWWSPSSQQQKWTKPIANPPSWWASDARVAADSSSFRNATEQASDAMASAVPAITITLDDTVDGTTTFASEESTTRPSTSETGTETLAPATATGHRKRMHAYRA
ncbi:hypothetical protein RQP46_000954 [Phenoliferia psychrophenolica]